MSRLFGQRNSDNIETLISSPSIITHPSLKHITKPFILLNSSECATTFSSLRLCSPLLRTCHALGYKSPTPVQNVVIPHLLHNKSDNLLVLSQTGSGKTAAYVLPILHHLSNDCYGPYAVILAPTRELARQIHQVVCTLGSSLQSKSILIVGGMDETHQSCQLGYYPHFIIGTPGRLAALLRRPNPPPLKNVRYVVLDEADRLLYSNSGFELDLRVIMSNITITGTPNVKVKGKTCQTLLFSATMTKSLMLIEKISDEGAGHMKLKKIFIGEDIPPDRDNNNEMDEIISLPKGLKQEYLFMPSRVKDAYLVTIIRRLMWNGGRVDIVNSTSGIMKNDPSMTMEHFDEESKYKKARSAVIFVSTCEHTALISHILSSLRVSNVALHSLLSQNRRYAALDTFVSQRSRILIATDIASRGLDIPVVDLVINADLPRRKIEYIHRVGRTARVGRRGRVISLICERDIELVHGIEKLIGCKLLKCTDVSEDNVVKMLGCVMKATRYAKRKLDEFGFELLVKKKKQRKKFSYMKPNKIN